MSAVPSIITSQVSKDVETFTYEKDLPKLPVPDLEETLNELHRSLEPLYYADGYYNHPWSLNNWKSSLEQYKSFYSVMRL